jgi:DNA invertase Pin-like site-specific DNA recombinase
LSGDTIVVTKLDRIARSARDLLNIVGDLKDRGVGFGLFHEEPEAGNLHIRVCEG